MLTLVSCSVTSFGTKDLRPEVSLSSAHAAIGEAVANFLALVLDPSDKTAQAYVDTKVAYTKDLLGGWLKAQAAESSVCAAAQRLNAANVTTKYTVSTTSVSNFASFDTTYPSVDASSKTITVVSELQPHLNPLDNSITDVATTEVDCKMNAEDYILKEFGDKGVVGFQGCQNANLQSLSMAESLVSETTLARYKHEGKPFELGPDVVYSTGVTWQHGSFIFKSDSSTVNVQSPRLSTVSVVLCKLLSASRLVEYMMVDGLPRFDGTVI